MMEQIEVLKKALSDKDNEIEVLRKASSDKDNEIKALLLKVTEIICLISRIYLAQAESETEPKWIH